MHLGTSLCEGVGEIREGELVRDSEWTPQWGVVTDYMQGTYHHRGICLKV